MRRILEKDSLQIKYSSRKSSEDKKLAIIVAIMLFFGIIGIFFVNTYTHIPPAPYSTLGFNNPTNLPNEVEITKSYNFNYNITSHEHNLTNYSVKTTFELFRLYDITEGLHSCLSPYRKKVYISWTNETNLTHISTPQKTPIPDLTIIPAVKNPINWTDRFTLTFDQGKSSGDGIYVIYYQNLETNKTLFEIKIFTKTGKVFFNNQNKSNITLHSQNDKIKLNYRNNHLEFIFNGNSIFSEPITLTPNAQFGFETRDVFMYVGNVKIQHKDEIDVPDKENIWEYIIDYNLIYHLQGELRSLQTVKHTLFRYYSDPDNFTKEEEKFQLNVPLNATKPSFWLESKNANNSLIPWADSILNITFPNIEPKANIVFLIGNSTKILITNSSITLDNIYGKYLIHVKNNKSKNNLIINLNNTNIKLTIENKSVNSKSSNMFNKSIRIYQVNTYKNVENIDLTHNKPVCFQKNPFEYCKLILSPITYKPQERKPNPSNYVETIIKKPVEEYVEKPVSKTTKFDGHLAKITNQTNYSLDTNFIYLDGEGIVKISLEEKQETVFDLILNLKQSKLSFKRNNLTVEKTILINNLTTSWISFKADLKNNSLKVFVNRTNVLNATIQPQKANNSRYFTYETMNTYVESKRLVLQKNNRRFNLPLTEDPCQLKLIKKTIIRENGFALNIGESKTFYDTISMDNFFDYGKVSVDVLGSSNMNNTALHTHFWLVRK